MSAYTVSFSIRYEILAIQRQAEVAVMKAATDILNEDPGTPDHAHRLDWATWANSNSGAATIPFMWSIGMNPTVVSAVEADPTGSTVSDSDVQFIVNANLDVVIASWTRPV